MILRSALILLTIVLTGTSRGAPIDNALDRRLSLRDCLEYADAHHSSVLSARKRVEAASAGLIRARAGYSPKLSAASEFRRVDFTTSADTSYQDRFGDTGSTLSHTLSVTQPILDGWRTPTAVRQSSASLRSALADLEQARQDRVLTVTTAYYEFLLACRLQEIADSTVREIAEQRELIQARIDTGSAAAIDIHPVDVQLAEARLTALKAANARRSAANRLRNAMGLPPGPELQIEDVDVPADRVSVLEECSDAALENRPELLSAAGAIEYERAALRLAKLQTGPVPTASAAYRRNFGDIETDSEWLIGAGLTMYVFDGGALAADVEASRSRLEALELSYEQLRNDIRNEVEQAYLDHVSAFEELQASKSSVELARINVEVAREKYQVGLGIPLEITTAERQYAEAQTAYVQALYDTHITRARLNRAVGRREF